MRKSELRKEREKQILSSLTKLGVSDIHGLKALNVSGLGKTSDRNVLRVLNEMISDGHLDGKTKEVKLFTIKGRGFGYYEHRLMMNRFLIKYGVLDQAQIEPTVQIKGIKFQPDFIIPKHENAASFKDWVFYEVDRKQKKKTNDKKKERYERLGLDYAVVCSPDRNIYWKDCPIYNV